MQEKVSVVILTYNSGFFVEETLDSVKGQTYSHLELIISDDGSTDNTVETCRNWIENNKDRFARTELITTNKNTGIPANFNRSTKAVKTEWIKFLSGDDALLPNCIEDNLHYVLTNPEVKVLYSYNQVYRNTFNEENFVRLNPSSYPKNVISENITAYQQYKILLAGNKVSFTPSGFINRFALIDAGLPDEDLFSEDYQLLLKLTRKGFKLYFMEKETVLYRQHQSAINNSTSQYIIKPHYFKTEIFRRRYIYPNVPVDIRLHYQYRWFVNQIFRFKFFNRNNSVNHFIYYLLNAVLNPFKYLLYIKGHFCLKYRNDLFYK